MKKNKNTKDKTWKLIYPDGTESIFNYDPIEKAKKEFLKIIEGIDFRKIAEDVRESYGTNIKEISDIEDLREKDENILNILDITIKTKIKSKLEELKNGKEPS